MRLQPPASAWAPALIALTVLAWGGAPARAADVEPVWHLDFEQPIGWQRVTSLGDLIVSTRDALHAVEPESGQVRWTRPDLGRLPNGGFEEIGGAPLVVIDDGALEPRTVILNMLTGALVFDSEAEGLVRIASRHLLPRSGSLLVVGFEQGNAQPTLFLYDIDDGRRLWSSDVLNEGLGGFMRAVVTAAIVLTDTSPMQSEPVELDDGTFIVGGMGHVYRFDRDTGEVLWKARYLGGRFELTRPTHRSSVVYVGAEEQDGDFASTHYQGFRLSDGTPVWKRPVRFNGPMNAVVIPVERGLIVSEGDRNRGGIRLLDYDSGESLWGKRGRGIRVKGQVLDWTQTDAGLVLTTGFDGIWAGRGTEYLLYVLDAQAGALRFEEPLEVAGRMLGTELIEHGLLYVTTREVNVLDPASGVLLNEPVFRGEEPLVTASDGPWLYAFDSDDGFLYRLDRRTGRIARFSNEPFELSGKDRARALDVLPEGVVLLGRQSVAAFGADGRLRHHSHFPAPRNPGWLRALAWAEGVRAGMASASAGLYSAAAAAAAAETAPDSSGRQLAGEFQRGFDHLERGYAGLARDYVSFARARYHASAESRDFAFVLTQDEERRVSLVQVGKLDGAIIGRIPLGRDREPDYQVDDIANRIFYHSTDSRITAYELGRAN